MPNSNSKVTLVQKTRMFQWCFMGVSNVMTNKPGLSWGSTRLKQLAWSLPTKFITQVGLDITIYLSYRIKIIFELANKFKPDQNTS